jgi:RluA family pseudouridine synthase
MQIEQQLLFRDASVLVLNKPANIAVHAGFGDTNTLDKYFPQLQFGLPQPPQLAHRLDRATSGCLVLGRHKQALVRLAHLFASGLVEKTYIAVVMGTPKETTGTINLPLGKQSAAKHRWLMKVDEKGQHALTEYRVLGSDGTYSVVELKPKTGRTHQLRVHLAAIGHPILGEWIYNGEHVMPAKIGLQLHASQIILPYSEKKPPIKADAPLPDHMKERVEQILATKN